jgi:hypothetical protein
MLRCIARSPPDTDDAEKISCNQPRVGQVPDFVKLWRLACSLPKNTNCWTP